MRSLEHDRSEGKVSNVMGTCHGVHLVRSWISVWSLGIFIEVMGTD